MAVELRPVLMCDDRLTETRDAQQGRAPVGDDAEVVDEPAQRRFHLRERRRRHHQSAERNLAAEVRSEEHTSELQSLMRISYAVFCLKKKNNQIYPTKQIHKYHVRPRSYYHTNR